MRIVRKIGLRVLLLATLGAVATGCMPGGAATNPGWTVVAVQEGIVYAALATGNVIALDGAQAGAELWSYPIQQSQGPGCGLVRAPSDDAEAPLDAVYGLPVVADDLLLVTSYNHTLYAFNRDTGSKEWERNAQEAIIGGVAVDGGMAYFGSSDHRVYALDLATREMVWDAPFETGNWVWGTPAVDEKTMYVGSMDHYVYALDRMTGTELWRQDVGASVLGTVTLADDRLFVGSIDRRLHTLSAEDGQEAWRTEVLEGWVWGEALVDEGYVYFGTLGSTVHALSVGDGSSRWRDVVTLEKGEAVRAGPALLGKYLIVGTDLGRLYVIDMETGSTQDVYKDLAGSVLSRPAVEDDRVYVGTTAGTIHALDSFPRAREVWVYPPPKEK